MFLLANFILIFAFQFSTSDATAGRRLSTGSETHIFCLIDTATNIPIGTVFAIAPNLLLSANHNRLDPDTNLPLEVSFSKLLRRTNGKIVATDKIGLKVLSFDTEEDWVIFERVDSEVFQDNAVLCDEQDLPDEDSEHNVEVTIRYYNAGLFQKKLKRLHRRARFVQYEESDELTHTENETEMIVADGAVSGVCGAPYYFGAKVVAFHVASDSEALEFHEKNELNTEVESLTSTHTHFSVGRVLCRLPAFMKFYRKQFKIKTTSNAVKKLTTASKIDVITAPKRRKNQAVVPGVAAKKRKL